MRYEIGFAISVADEWGLGHIYMRFFKVRKAAFLHRRYEGIYISTMIFIIGCERQCQYRIIWETLYVIPHFSRNAEIIIEI